jgi:hypothetical protein
MKLLADSRTDSLDSEMVRRDIIPLLSSAPAFIAGKILPAASQEEVATQERLRDVDDMSRGVKKHHYDGRLDKDEIECTSDERRDTQDFLVYLHGRAQVIELALTNFLQAVETVNAAFEGRTQGRAL